MNDVWYHVYPLGFLAAEEENRSFRDEQAQSAHRLRRLDDWLGYWSDLGVTGILLGPCFQSETHGYDVLDPFTVDRRLGTEEDLVRLIDQCHQRSLKVGLDLVLHHVGRQHPKFVDVVQRRELSPWRHWFHVDFNRPGPLGFTYANFEGHDQLVKLKHAHPAVLDWAVDVAHYWLARDVDGFRLDAAYAVPTLFWAAWADRVRAVRPDVLLLGEAIRGDYAHLARQGHLDSITQYELWKAIWSSLNDRNFFELSHALERHQAYSRQFQPWTFLGNHDTTRIRTQLRDGRLLPHALALLFTLPGLPAVYAGDEQGARGTKHHRVGGDRETRQPPPCLPGQLDADAQWCWQLHRDLIALRRARPWLSRAECRVVQLSNTAIAVEMRAGSARLLTALNTADAPAPCPAVGGLVPLAGTARPPLPPHGWGVWLAP